MKPFLLFFITFFTFKGSLLAKELKVIDVPIHSPYIYQLINGRNMEFVDWNEYLDTVDEDESSISVPDIIFLGAWTVGTSYSEDLIQRQRRASSNVKLTLKIAKRFSGELMKFSKTNPLVDFLGYILKIQLSKDGYLQNFKTGSYFFRRVTEGSNSFYLTGEDEQPEYMLRFVFENTVQGDTNE
jgi:hypothetical protein